MDRKAAGGSPDSPCLSVTPWAWRSSCPVLEEDPLPADFFLRKTADVARDLLGCRIQSRLGGVASAGVIVEVEAYVGPGDPASHAAARIGRTRRNVVMFGPPGRAYVYRSYGIHWCLNAVTEEEGFPGAVLLRALDPIVGVEHMVARREGRMPLCSGPGRVGQALGVSGELNGHPFSDSPLTISAGWPVAHSEIGISGRIGISRAADWPLRFYLRGHPEVSGKPR